MHAVKSLKLYSILFAANTDFQLSHRKYKNCIKFIRAYLFLEEQNMQNIQTTQ